MIKKVVSHLDSRHKHMDPANFQEEKPISMMLTQFISSIIYVKYIYIYIYQHNILLVHKVDQVSTYGSGISIEYYWPEFS